MLYKNIDDLSAFTAGDATLIREVLHPKNGDGDLSYSLAYAVLEPGGASLPHRLIRSTEVYIIVEGHGTAFINQLAVRLEPGSVVVIPAGAEQFVRNEGLGALKFLCIVSPPWQADAEIVEGD